MKPECRVHVVDKIGHADFHCCPGQTGRSYDECHRSLLVSKDMLDTGADLSSATVGTSHLSRQGIVDFSFAMDLRAQTVFFQMIFVGLWPVDGIGPDIAGCIVRIKEEWKVRPIVAGSVGCFLFAGQPIVPINAHMVLVAEHEHSKINPVSASFTLAYLIVQRASRSFCASFLSLFFLF